MIRTDKRLRLCVCLIALNLLFIWGNSLLPGEVSGEISDAVQEILAAVLPGDDESASGGGLIRKLAHVTEFTCLGALLAWLSGMLQRSKGSALLLGIAAACVDETIQRFVPDRGPSLWDVLIDSSGVLLGIALVLLGHSCVKRKQDGG